MSINEYRKMRRIFIVSVLGLALMHYYSGYTDTNVKYSLQGAKSELNINMTRKFDEATQRHPYLNRECYTYENFTAIFKCNETHLYRKFSKDLIYQCASNMWKAIRNPDEVDPWEVDLNSSSRNSDPVAISRRPSVHWIFSGDSHIRNVFEVLLRRLVGPRVKYRIAGENHWQDTEAMIANTRNMKHAPYQQVILLDYPLKITVKWQPMWQGIENDLKLWLSEKELRPTRLFLGGVLHFMIHAEEIFKAEGPIKASQNFANQLKILIPLLKNFTLLTPTIYKLSDHVQVCLLNNVTNNDNIDLYNKIANEALQGTGVKLWDSAIPLSDINNEECRLRYKQSGQFLDMSDWRCSDKRHIGYIFIEQYLDMVLNDMCDDFLYR